MGVKGLWKLVAQAGHQINIETLHGRILAVDVSIWIVQFLKAMRGNDGKPVKNCHLLGTLKRVARLLYHNIRPVFVFDGSAPALKLQTIKARHQRRGEADLNVERSARRILAARMNRLLSSNNTAGGVQENRDESSTCEEKGSENEVIKYNNSNNKKDQNENSSPQAISPGVVLGDVEDNESIDNTTTSIAPDVMMTGDGNRTNREDEIQWQPGDSNDREGWEEESMDNEDDILLPEDDGVDISVIAALPVHMRKKVIEKAQRNERMRSRRTYMPLAADPQRFCDAQIQNLIRGSKLNREIRNLQEESHIENVGFVSKEMGGAAERSIASDETRKYIVTTESNVNGNVQGTVEGRLGTYDGFAEWECESLSNEEGHNMKYGGFVVFDDSTKVVVEDCMKGQESSSSSSTMAIKHEAVVSVTNVDCNKMYKNVDTNKKKMGRYDNGADGYVLPNMMGAATAATTSDGTIKRVAVLEEEKDSNKDGCNGFIVDSNSVSLSNDTVNKNIEISPPVHKMDSSGGQGGQNLVSGLNNQCHTVNSRSNSTCVMITPTVVDNEVQNQERQDNVQVNYPSQWDNAVQGGEERYNKNSHISHEDTGAIEFSSSTLHQEEEDHGGTATTTLEQLQREHTRAENGNHENNERGCIHEEFEVHDVELEFNPETINILNGGGSFCHPIDAEEDSHPPPSFHHPISDPTTVNSSSSRVDEIIEKSSGILGNMPDYVKRQFVRHIKEYRKAMVPQSSMDDELENTEKIPGSSVGIILKEDEWEDGIAAAHHEVGCHDDHDNDSSPIPKEVEEDHVGNSDAKNNYRDTFSAAECELTAIPLTVVPSQCKTEEGDNGSLKIENTLPPPPPPLLPLAALPARVPSSSNRAEPFDGGMVNYPSHRRMETTMSQATDLNVEECNRSINNNNNNLVMVNATDYKGTKHQDTRDGEFEERYQNLQLDNDTVVMTTSEGDGDVGSGDVCVPTKYTDEIRERDGKYQIGNIFMNEVEMEEEEEDARKAHVKALRDADTITDEMREEVMGLLELLGVPYIVAPMEAEAQCVELERLNLVEGSITDDSDALVFGSQNAYKNIFEDGKNVEAYKLSDIQCEIGIGTEEMQCLAMLLGSDYTEGINGVGPVNAMEIVEAFSIRERGVMQGLMDFREWLEAVVDPAEQKRLSRLSHVDVASLSLMERFSVKHRNARLRWAVKRTFPEKDVIKAYKHPRVNSSMKKFSWYLPDEAGLHKFCSELLGWDHQQSTKLIDPITKKLKERGGGMRQRHLDDYFVTYGDNERFARFRSKRLRTAVEVT